MQQALNYAEAYDLSRFDRRTIQREKVAKEKSLKKAELAKKSKPMVSFSAVVTWVLCMALLVMIAYSYMVLNEAADQVNQLQRELDTLREQTQMMEIQKSQKYGSEQMQKIAVEQLGMQKIEKSQITYVNTKSSDHTEIAQTKTMRVENSKVLAGIANGFNTIVEYIN